MGIAELSEKPSHAAISAVRLAFRSWLRELRHAPDRLLHPIRRTLIRRSLARRDRPRAVLFLCHGNVCRSPYAAASFARSVSDSANRIGVTSAGFIGPDRSSPDLAIEAARRKGIDLSAHRSTLVTTQAMRFADLVVVMSAEQARDLALRFGHPSSLVLGDLDPNPIRRRTILDPWDGDAQAFDESYGRIERCVTELVRILGSDR